MAAALPEDRLARQAARCVRGREPPIGTLDASGGGRDVETVGRSGGRRLRGPRDHSFGPGGTPRGAGDRQFGLSTHQPVAQPQERCDRPDRDAEAGRLRGSPRARSRSARLRAAPRQVRPRARRRGGLLFYAGHALQISEKNYLVSTSARLDSEFLIASEAIELEPIIRLME